MPKLKDFKPQTINANKHTQRGGGLLEKSLREDGYSGEAMVAAADKELFIGSNRLEKSAAVFGLDVEPIVVESDGTRPVVVVRTDIPTANDPRARRLGLGSNRIASLSLDWDVSVLQTFDLPDLDAVGFDERALADLGVVERQSKDAPPETDRAAELLEKWQVKTGDLWQIGNHRLVCGDCTDAAVVARVMGGEKADMVFTDPPYGVDLEPVNIGGLGKAKKVDEIIGDNNTEAARNFWKLVAEWNCIKVIWGGNYFTDFLPLSPHWIVWNKLAFDKPSQTFSHCELAWTNAELNTVRMYSHVWDGAFREGKKSDEGKTRLHPAQKPAGLSQTIISDYIQGGLVLDAFSGSGTTLVACENLGRKCRAVEISPAYVAVALERMATAFPALDIRRVE